MVADAERQRLANNPHYNPDLEPKGDAEVIARVFWPEVWGMIALLVIVAMGVALNETWLMGVGVAAYVSAALAGIVILVTLLRARARRARAENEGA